MFKTDISMIYKFAALINFHNLTLCVLYYVYYTMCIIYKSYNFKVRKLELNKFYYFDHLKP